MQFGRMCRRNSPGERLPQSVHRRAGSAAKPISPEGRNYRLWVTPAILNQLFQRRDLGLEREIM